MNIRDIIRLYELLAELGHVKRATKLPNHEPESDSHHSFSLALIAYQICKLECPELDADKVLKYGLAHDLLEIITGDENTLHYTPKQHAEKHAREQKALKRFNELFAEYPDLRNAMYEYEKLDTPEAAAVFVLDKACTTWTHHIHNAQYARSNNVCTKADVGSWSERQREKFNSRLKIMPPKRILEIYTESFEVLKGLYDN